MENEFLALIFFDDILGPTIFHQNTDFSSGSDQPNLERILDFTEEEGSFVFAFRKYQTNNYIFYLDSPLSRGGQIMVMVSYLIKAAYFKKEIVDIFRYLEMKTPILKKFTSKLKKIKGLPLLLLTKKKVESKEQYDEQDLEQIKQEFLSVFLDFQDKLFHQHKLDDDYFEKSGYKKIFIFGPIGSGKASFLNNIEEAQFRNQYNNDLPTILFESVIENLVVITYDCIEQDLNCIKCKNFGGCIKNSNGFILLFDLGDQESIKEATYELEKILTKFLQEESRSIPLIIIGNQIKGKISKDDVPFANYLYLDKYQKEGIELKYFILDVLNDREGDMNALRWLVKQMI